MSQSRDEAERVLIFDTTLRDGEQCPSATMTYEEKLTVADLLDDMGVDVIEAGFPANGDDDFQAVEEIGRRAKRAIICGLARAVAFDIDQAGAAVRSAKRGRIHTFIATSPEHREFKLRLSKEQVLERIVESVSRARNLIDDVEWSAEAATQTEHDYLCRCVEAAIKAGATTINIPDTLGYTEPEEYYMLIRMLRDRVPNAENARFSVHCHDDLGMAVANSLAGIRGGARQVECTILGIGERAGNASLEEIVMAIKTRNDRFPFWTGIDSRMFMRAAKLLTNVTTFTIPFNKAVVGRNAFAHESGIHQDGMLKRGLYEIMKPEDIGRAKSDLVIGKHSGRAALANRVVELGYPPLGENHLDDLMARIKSLGAHKKEIYDEDIEVLLDDEIAAAQDRIKFVGTRVYTSTEDDVHRAFVRLNVEGKLLGDEVRGNGPLDAMFNCIKALVPHEAVFSDFVSRAIGEHTDAQAYVSLTLSSGAISVAGRAADTDSNAAACKAYIHALNLLLIKKEKERRL